MVNFKRNTLLLILITTVLSIKGQTNMQSVGIGSWRDHFIYRNVIAITESDSRLYAATKYGLIYIDKNDHALYRFNKIQGLSSTGVSTINYSYKTNSLVIAYADGNIDIYKNNRVYNISDIKRKNINGSKQINKITFDENFAYLACNFGIAVVDLIKLEIKEAYFIGINNSSLKVNEVAICNNTIYAATESGLKAADKTKLNLNDYNNWISDNFFAVDSNVTRIFNVDTNVFVATKTNVALEHFYKKNGNSWIFKDSMNAYSAKPWSGKILISMKENTGEPKIKILNTDFVEQDEYLFSFPSSRWVDISPTDAWISKDDYVWSATGISLLYYIKTDRSSNSIIYMDSPELDDIFWLSAGSQSTYGTQGGMATSFSPLFNVYKVSNLRDNQWHSYLYNQTCAGENVRTFDAMYVAEDPYDANHFFASSWFSGIFEYRNGSCVASYNETNSSLQAVSGDGSIRVSGIAFDNNGNLWSANGLVPNILSERKTDGSWQSYNLSLYISDLPNKIIVDYYNQKWITFKGTQLLVAKENESGDIDAAIVDPNNGNDNTTINVNCIVEDKLGYIWIGTEKGIKVNYNSMSVLSKKTGNTSNTEFKLIIVGGKTSGYPLLSTESVTCIAVDGADRKWIGTQTAGIFLVSPDGTEEIHHFTVDNSPLISNTITAVTIDPKTGEVLIGTDKGLMGFQGDATIGGTENKNVLVFPNPVKPNYSGQIAVKGLVDEADVRIADINGNVLFRTIAKGGMATWDGKGPNGKRPKSGVYFVFITNSDGSQTAVAKIFFIK